MRKGYIRPAVLLELEKMADDFTHFAKKTAQLPKNSKTNKNKLHGTWERETKDLWTSSMGRVGRERGTLMITAKVGGKCDISFFVKMCYLWSTLDSIVQNHIGLLMFTQ